MLDDPFYYLKPVVIGGHSGFTAGYNTLIEEARVLQFYLTHPYFQDEAAAKALAFLNPQRALELIRPTFKGLALTGSQSKALYENLFKIKIDAGEAKLPWQQEWQKLYLEDVAKYILSAEKLQGMVPPRVYPRSVLLGIAHMFLKTGLSPEVMAQIQEEAQLNANKSDGRYLKRTRERSSDVPKDAAWELV